MKKARIHDLMAKAKRATSAPQKRAGDEGWTAHVPLYDDKPNGPTTEVWALTYAGIWAWIRASRARVFLALAEQEYGISHRGWHEEVLHLTYRLTVAGPRGKLTVDSWESACRALVRKYRHA